MRAPLCVLLLVLNLTLPIVTVAPAGAADTTAELRGTVTDPKTGKPIANVRVDVVSQSGRYHVFTNDKGFYDLLGVAPDTYVVSFTLNGYQNTAIQGISLFNGAVLIQNATLDRLKTIIRTSVRAPSSAFNPSQTDSYTLTQTQINQAQGKAFNQDETNLLRSIPSVTEDKSGTISIRGGFAFEAAYEYEGIDYTVPNANLQNTQQNTGNFNLINGVSSAEVIPGGGDASHGNSGTGLIEFTAKRGTYPTEFNADLESNLYPYGHQFGFEFGIADYNKVISNYFSFIGQRDGYQYGGDGVPASILGTRGTNAATLNSTVNPNLVYYSPSFLASNDFVDNLVFKFGHNKTQSLQFFFQGQAIKQDLDYGGISNLQYFTGGTGQGYCPATSPRKQVSYNTPSEAALCDFYLPLYPGQQNGGSFLASDDQLYSPFEAFKFEYQNPLTSRLFLAARYYRTFSDQSQQLPSAAISAPQFGGTRSAIASELTDVVSPHHTLEVGLRYGFSTPYGTIDDGSKYGALTYGTQITQTGNAASYNFNPPTLIAGAPAIDFLTPSLCSALQYPQPGTPADLPPVVRCGYLNSYFPGGVPRFPTIVEAPPASVQDYALFAQDSISLEPSGRLKFGVGLRLDGYNFLQPLDPSDPPGLVGLSHQRQYEPHLGSSWQLTNHDALRANFGHTLSIPLPSLLGTSVLPSSFSAFAGIPSFDNSTGAPASYCGLSGKALCSNYASQLYWLTRNYIFGAQPANVALQGATFTNIDFSYEHLFDNGIALKMTPFYRRGYDIAETAASILGYSDTTGAPVYGDQITTTQGQQKATGAEFLATLERTYGFSASFGLTYINQFGNEPPGAYLTPASLDSGTLYHSPDLSPLQLTIATTYRTHSGLRINPVVYFNRGYPYGIGYYTPAFCGANGASTVANTGNTPGSSQNGAPSYVDPENPGSCQKPVIAITRGNVEPNSAGGLYSPPQANANVTFEWSPPGTASTFGIQLRNLFNQLYNVPVTNYCYGIPISTGTIYRNGVTPCSYSTPANTGPAPNAFPNSPYNVYPNLQPFTARVYYQLKM